MSRKVWQLLSLFLLGIIIILKVYFYGTDISLYPVKAVGKTYNPHKIWLISYANEGIHIQNQNNLIMSATMTQAFDVIIPYQSHHIEPEYYQQHKEILMQKRGAGYWLWKPYFILKTLKQMPENDVLLYLDSSIVFREGIYQILDLVKQHDIILFPNFHNNRGYVKHNIIKELAHDDASLLDKVQIEGNILLFKNTPRTRALVEEWLKYCEDPTLLTDIPSENEYPDFKDNRHDQAILSILYHLHPERYHLYDAYPARMKAFIVTRRQAQCSMIPVTFGSNSEFGLWERFKYRSIMWLIGCQTFKGH